MAGAPVTGRFPATPAAIPPVVVVLVAHDPGPWFEETLGSLAGQTYRDLAVLVIDAGSAEDQTDRVRAVLPRAHVHRLESNRGYAYAANLAPDLVDGAAFYAFCHDDVALDPDAIRTMVEEAFRSNAGIVGPKLVDWHDPQRLRQVGMGADKTGVMAPIAEPGELDQEQHDAVRDVFVVPGGCTLVRVDLFRALGGFDSGIDYLGEDLDLSWRTHLLGARVMIAPAARVRHLEALGERRPVDDRRRLLARHRLRTTMVAYGRWNRIRVVPQAVVIALVEMVYGVLAGRPDRARDVFSAWTWNFRRRRQIRARRRVVQESRQVGDAEIREMQVRGSARFSSFLRGQVDGRDDRVSSFTRSSRDLAGAVRAGSRQLTGTFAIILGLLLVIGSRELIFDELPVLGEFARFPDGPGTFLETWWSGWRRTGLGAAGPQPTAYGLLGVLGTVALGFMGLLRTVLILGTVPLGALGAWRLARPIGSARASVAAFAVYLAIPVPYNAVARGSWSGLLVYAVSPWLLLLMGKASGVAPFGPGGAEPGEKAATTSRRRSVGLICSLGLLLAVTAAFVPFVLVIATLLAVAMAAGSLLCFRVAGMPRMLVITAVGIVLAVALHLPWSLEILRASSPWEAVAGLSSTSGGPLGLGRVLRFETGPWGAPPLGWAFLLAGILPVVIGRSWRLEWAVRAWFVVLGGWGIVWAGQEGHLPMGLPAPEVMLAPVAAALALAAALGLAAFETDLRAYRFGWRQVLSVLAALGVVLGALPLASGVLDGRWRTPSRDYTASLDRLVRTEGRAPFRVLWVGDPEFLPASGWRFNEDLAYVSTDRGTPTVLDRIPGPPPGSTHLLADSLNTAMERRTNRVGHLLAPMGVRYLIVPSRLAPTSGSDTGRRAVPTELAETLSQQSDLREVPVAEGLAVFENTAWVSSRAVLPELDGDRTDYTQAVADDLADGLPAVIVDQGNTDATGEVPAEGDVLVASGSDDGWGLTVDGVPMDRSEIYGWANRFTATRTGDAELTFDTPIGHRLAVLGQVLGWVVVVVVWRRVRHAERVAADRTAPVGGQS